MIGEKVPRAGPSTSGVTILDPKVTATNIRPASVAAASPVTVKKFVQGVITRPTDPYSIALDFFSGNAVPYHPTVRCHPQGTGEGELEGVELGTVTLRYPISATAAENPCAARAQKASQAGLGAAIVAP